MNASRGYADSSVRRMVWAALLGAEHWLRQTGIQSQPVDDWLDHMWDWLLDEREFHEWYDSRPALVDSQYRPLPPDVVNECHRIGLPSEDLRELIGAVTGVLYGNLFGSITWQWVDDAFDRVAGVLARYELGLPPEGMLPKSGREEDRGWGLPAAKADILLSRRGTWVNPSTEPLG